MSDPDDLHPGPPSCSQAVLDALGLLPTLHRQVQRFTQQTGAAVDFKHSGLEIALPPPIAIAAYRIVQAAARSDAAGHE